MSNKLSSALLVLLIIVATAMLVFRIGQLAINSGYFKACPTEELAIKALELEKKELELRLIEMELNDKLTVIRKAEKHLLELRQEKDGESVD